MKYDFTSLPKTRAEVTDWYNYVSVPCITEGHANLRIVDQEQGAKYLQDRSAKFPTEQDFQNWRDKYSKAVASFCNQYSA
jgi:hypothetical protein